jgi:hypothetical protein
VRGEADKAANLGRCKSSYRQLPGFGRLACPLCATLPRACELRLEVLRSANREHLQLQPERAGTLFQTGPALWKFGGRQNDRHSGQTEQGLAENFELLRAEFGKRDREASDVATRPSQALRPAFADRIATANHHDGNGARAERRPSALLKRAPAPGTSKAIRLLRGEGRLTQIKVWCTPPTRVTVSIRPEGAPRPRQRLAAKGSRPEAREADSQGSQQVLDLQRKGIGARAVGRMNPRGLNRCRAHGQQRDPGAGTPIVAAALLTPKPCPNVNMYLYR